MEEPRDRFSENLKFHATCFMGNKQIIQQTTTRTRYVEEAGELLNARILSTFLRLMCETS